MKNGYNKPRWRLTFTAPAVLLTAGVLAALRRESPMLGLWFLLFSAALFWSMKGIIDYKTIFEGFVFASAVIYFNAITILIVPWLSIYGKHHREDSIPLFVIGTAILLFGLAGRNYIINKKI